MTESDYELLVNAALALGKKAEDIKLMPGALGGIAIRDGERWGAQHLTYFNPLMDKDQALSLAVQLKLRNVIETVPLNGARGKAADTIMCRAIVQAAAKRVSKEPTQ